MAENKEKTRENDFYDEDDEDTQKDKYLTFAVGRQRRCRQARSAYSRFKIQNNLES